MTNLAQSPHVPAEGKKPGIKDMGWLLAYSVRGFAELVRARIVFARLEARDIRHRNAAARRAATKGPQSGITTERLARIAFVLPRLSDRLPWRSDCLIQAVAAQNWLEAEAAYGEIRIGVERPEDGPFGAHAWLVHEGAIVTGGDVSRYSLLLADDPSPEVVDDSEGA